MASLLGKSKDMRGLQVFISDLRNSGSKEAEAKRVNKEMANIRNKFRDKKSLDGYGKKKYVCKLLFMYILGYEVDFGNMEAIQLLSSDKFTEKLIGYIAVSLIMHEAHPMLRLLINSMQLDLNSRNENFNCMALTTIGNIGNREIAEQLATVVQNLLIASTTRTIVRKKAALCLTHLFHKAPETIDLGDGAQEKLIQLLDAQHLGFLNCLMSFLLAVAHHSPEGFDDAIPRVIHDLQKVVLMRDVNHDYMYYGVICPWLQIKFLRFLRAYPPPTEPAQLGSIIEILRKILASADSIKGQVKVSYKNALNSVLFEAIELAIHYANDDVLIGEVAGILGKFILYKETNVRYLGLEGMAHLAMRLPDASSALIRRHQETVIQQLRDPDISIRRRALDLLYGMCDKATCQSIVSELLGYLTVADYDIREELVIKIAILAEKFASNYSWYVDTVIQLIGLSESVPDDIWHRVIRIVTNYDDIQEYAAKTVFHAASNPACHEATIRVAGYILGEFGHLIADNEGSRPLDQFRILYQRFQSSDLITKGLLLSTFTKFLNLYPEEAEMAQAIVEVLRHYAGNLDAEIQQRSVEYLNLVKFPNLMGAVWEIMPPFPERSDEEDGDKKNTLGTNIKKIGPQEELPPLEVLHIDSPAVHPNQGQRGIPEQAPQPRPNPGLPIPNLTPKNREFYNRLCLVSEGVLYEDEFLQIGVRSSYQTSFGRLMLYYGNAASFPLTNFTTFIPPVPEFTIQTQPVPTEIGAGVQMQQAMAITCNSEFKDSPLVGLAFDTPQGRQQVTLILPIIVSKFCAPIEMNKDEFFGNWKQISGPPMESGVVLKANKPIDPTNIAKILSSAFHFSALQNIDANPNNLILAAKFNSAGKEVLCMARIEANTQVNLFRMTVRTFSAQITPVLTALLSAQLGDPIPS